MKLLYRANVKTCSKYFRKRAGSIDILSVVSRHVETVVLMVRGVAGR